MQIFGVLIQDATSQAIRLGEIKYLIRRAIWAELDEVGNDQGGETLTGMRMDCEALARTESPANGL